MSELEYLPDYPISKLKFDETNPNELTESDNQANKKFLEIEGNLKMVLIDQNDLVVDGSHFVKNLLDKGDTTIPVFRKHFKDDIERKMVRQFINYGPRGKPVKSKQVEEILAIFNSKEYENFLQVMNKTKDEHLVFLEGKLPPQLQDDANIQTPKTTTVKPGDIYELNNHRLMCGDSLNENHIVSLLNGKKPRLVFTDPPYDLKKYDYLFPFFESLENIEVLIFNDDKGTKELCQDSRYGKFLINFFLIWFNSPSKYSNQPMMSHRIISHFRKGKSNFKNLHDAFGTVHEVVLSKSGFTRQDKPLEIPKKFIIHYTSEDESVVDLFGGSGSTLIACEVLQRQCFMMEKDPLRVDVIIKRWEKGTHDSAKKIN